jgi:hypothetical protein
MHPHGPHSLLYVGMRFALADSPEAYVILAQGQTPPVQVFERSPTGWGQAWQVFSSWEPHARPARLPSAPVANLPARTGPLLPAQAPAAYGAGYWTPAWGPTAFRPASGVAVAGGITGIVGAVLSLIPLLGILLGLLLGPVAVILSSIGLAQSEPSAAGGPRPKGMAVAGLVLGILTIVFKLIPGVDLL